ncbi:MAG: pitrilysin family protein [Pseudomonadota bacterium]
MIHRTPGRAVSAAAIALAWLNLVPASALAQARPHASRAAQADPLADLSLDVPATRFVLRNGLTVIVHEDHSAPLVAVNIWYHVGSKNEPKGKAGFAHLFEHLMFNGSENFDDDFFKATQKIGASDQNGTTNPDRTNYFQTVPAGALDTILWLESDRMGHLLGAIDQGKLDEQRKVVQNEKRQGDNRPYAAAEDLVIRATTPVGHPYDHSTIGSMADLDAASLEEVRDWFRAYYGPSNAVIVLAGDITTAEARAKMEKYFGDIPPGTPVANLTSWVVRRTGTVRETVSDRVAQPRLIRTWNVSDYASPDTDYLQILASLLAGGKTSRLYKRLVLGEQLATQVGASVDNREIGGQFQIDVMLKPAADIDRVERIVDEELRRLIATGPTPAELGLVRTSTLAGFARSLESIASKAGLLAESQTYLGSADGWKAGVGRLQTATPADTQRVGRAWLSDGDYVLRMMPFGDLAASDAHADRKVMPMPAAAAPASFPAVERATLPNGLKLVVARRTGAPLVSMTLLLDTGTPADFAKVAPGTGGLVMNLLDEATTRRTGEQLAEALAGLGARLGTAGGAETGTVSLSTLKPALRPSFDLFADVVLHPAFAVADIARLKAQTLAGIAATREDPARNASRLLPRLVYGPDNPYGQILTEASVAAIGRPQIQAFYDRWFHPGNATLVVAGDATLAEIRPLVEAAFGAWPAAPVPATIAPEAVQPAKPVIYLVDKPGTPQTVIKAAVIAPPRTQGDEAAREAFGTMLGGSFTSRLNMKLREEKGWAYGAGSGFTGTRGVRLLVASASVQADRSADSMREMATILGGIGKDRPIDTAELATARDNLTLGLGNDWATSAGIASYLIDQSAARLPDDYYAHYPAAITGVSLDAANSAASSIVGHPLIWVVVGDRAKIEAAIRALDIGEVLVVDADGNALR